MKESNFGIVPGRQYPTIEVVRSCPQDTWSYPVLALRLATQLNKFARTFDRKSIPIVA